MPTVLVTGGAGYVGSHACKALARAGFEPVVLDNLAFGHAWAVKWGPLVEGDTADIALVREVIAKYRPIAVMHFAAFAYVGESTVDPQKYYRNNLTGTLALLEAMLACDVRQFVFSSTCATYGVPGSGAIPEDHPQKPINPYGRTKLMIEQVLDDYRSAYDLRAVSLRYFNAAGADPDAEIGEDHDPETHIIPLALDAAAGRRPNVTIFGTDYPTPDGTCIRDYIHVTDLADAHVRALRYLQDGAAGASLNLGVGTGHSVREIIAAARALTGRDIAVIEGQRRPGDPPLLVAQPGRAHKVLGWQPTLSSLDGIIGSAWRWHRHHFGGQSP